MVTKKKDADKDISNNRCSSKINIPAVEGKPSAQKNVMATPAKEDPTLSVDEKRTIAYEWFVDKDACSIESFCIDVKSTPKARGFVRKACRQLNLASLRKERLQ
eukprot:887589_1